MAYYITCIYCGANLDSGEKCDCQKKECPDYKAEGTPNNKYSISQTSIKCNNNF